MPKELVDGTRTSFKSKGTVSQELVKAHRDERSHRWASVRYLPLPFESRLRGFLGRGRYSFALDYPLAVWRSNGLDGWYAGVLGHFGVHFSGRLFEIVVTTAG